MRRNKHKVQSFLILVCVWEREREDNKEDCLTSFAVSLALFTKYLSAVDEIQPTFLAEDLLNIDKLRRQNIVKTNESLFWQMPLKLLLVFFFSRRFWPRFSGIRNEAPRTTFLRISQWEICWRSCDAYLPNSLQRRTSNEEFLSFFFFVYL